VTAQPTAVVTGRRRIDARLLGMILVIASACGFGSGALLAKPVYAAGVDWLALLFWRFCIAAALSWVWLLFVPANRSALLRLSRRRIGILIGLGVFFVANSGTYYAALETVPASLAALIVYLYPVLVAALTLRFGRRLEGRRAWVALVIASSGVVLAVGGIPEGAAPPLWGLVLTVASPVFYAIWIVAAARLGGERRDRPVALASPPADSEAAVNEATDPAPATAVMTSATAVSYLVLMLLAHHSISPASVPSSAWPGIIGVGVIATAFAVQAFYAGARRVGAARASLISTVEPIYTVVLAALLLGESLAPVQLLGGALILGGVLLAETG
jgi:drug/metabolite transporter (DMT)-like permease